MKKSVSVSLGIPRRRDDRRDAPPRPDTSALIDRFGRVATDLRVSLIDRCNLRCAYCMPEDAQDWLPTERLLTADEIVRLVGIGVDMLGVRHVRFTGGEPLLRPDLERIISGTAALASSRSPVRISMTTNGIGLADRAITLREAGLRRVNISLDTLDRETFKQLALRDKLDDVLRGIEASIDAGLAPVKLNAVLLRGVNDHEVTDLVRFAADHNAQLRFIEQMPLEPHERWSRSGLLTAEEILSRIGEEFDVTDDSPVRRGSAPAELFYVTDRRTGRRSTIGVIGSVTRPFCEACDRTRLTSDGAVRNCLFAHDEVDLRTPMRNGEHDGQLAERWRQAMWAKKAGHGIDDDGFRRPSRPMNAIGG